MIRLALLIGSPSHPSTPEAGKYLSGVKTDIENMEGFLKSSIGGSWKESEVKIFQYNPLFSQVEPFLKTCEKVDFAFVYFSGHGGTDVKNGKPRVVFNSFESPFIVDLANRAKRQITIIDACRGYVEFINLIGEEIGKIDFPNPKPVFARAVYNKYIEQMPDSRVLFFASQKGQDAQDTGSKGGLFSLNLLSAAIKLVETKNDLVVNVSQVFHEAHELTKKHHQPELQFLNENSKKLPFAIKPNFVAKQIQYQNIKHVEKNTTIIEDIAKAALITAGFAAVGIIIDSLLSGKKK